MRPTPATRRQGTRRAHPIVPSRDVVERVIRECYEGPAWQGPNLRGALRGVRARDARRRPLRGRHTIWELVLHLAYARHRIAGRLRGAPDRRFPRPLRTNWWPHTPSRQDDRHWRADLALLAESQAELLAALSAAPKGRLAGRRQGKAWSLAQEALGVANHDAYHTGQILLLRKPARRRA
ncbi:MAG TPA: DinB family protein [Gemmatimonadaceae bacterium]|nr:DinB family protein [Gemmatimonadaceae bacterium]